MSYSDYSIRSFTGGFDKNLTYLVTCMRTSNQFLMDASVPLKKISSFVNRRGLITLFITHTHPDHYAFIDEYVDAFLDTKFEPSGNVVGNDRILSASSILDYVFRELAISYLGKEELAHTPSIASTKAINTENSDDKFLKIVKNITSKGFVRSNYEEKLVDLSDVRINLKTKN